MKKANVKYENIAAILAECSETGKTMPEIAKKVSEPMPYIDILAQIGLINLSGIGGSIVHETTEKGMDFLGILRDLHDLPEPEANELPEAE
jgi:hypothetical protein